MTMRWIEREAARQARDFPDNVRVVRAVLAIEEQLDRLGVDPDEQASILDRDTRQP